MVRMTAGDSRRRHWARGLAVAAGLSMALSVASAGPALGHAEHGHPARIHNGTCEDLGGVAFRLNGVGASVDLDNAPIELPADVNPDKAYQVMVSETTIDGSLDDLLAADHAVMVYESDEAMDVISCGNLGGAMAGDTLITGLAEAGIPGHIGFAMFAPDGEQTVVSIILGHALAPMSATGGGGSHDHAEGNDDHAHEADEADHAGEDSEEDGHESAATPHA